jgi:hypothetical protein
MSKAYFKVCAIAIISTTLVIAGCKKKSSKTATNNQGTTEGSQRATWITDEGVEYSILAIGEMFFFPDKERMLTVKYLSKDPNNKGIRDKEFADLYVLVAKNLKLDGFDLVGLTAVNKPPKPGFQKVSGYRDMKPVEQVRKMAN